MNRTRPILASNTIVKATLLVSAITLFTKLIGYAEKVVVAYIWGTGYEADTYNAVFAILIAIAIFFRESFEPGFLNTSLKLRKHSGNTESQRVFTTMLCFIGAVSLLLSAIMFLYPGIITDIFLSGFTGAHHNLAKDFFMAGSVGLLFLLLATVTNTELLSHKSFSGIAYSDFIFKVVILLCIFVLHRAYGIYAIIIGFVLAALVKFAIQVVLLRRHMHPRDFRPAKDYLQAILILSWPLLIGNIFSQISTIADNTFASHLSEGAISSLSYAKKIIDLPVVLIPYTLSIVVFPFFSEMSIEKDSEKLTRVLKSALKYILLLFIPAMIAIGIFPDEIIKIIFERGAFDSSSTIHTAQALSTYNIGLVAYALETIMVIFLFSTGRIKIPVIIGIICVITDILLIAVMINKLGYLAIAFALAISKWLKITGLSFFMPRGLFARTRFTGLMRITAALTIFVIPLLIYHRFFIPHIDSTIPLAFSMLGFIGGSFMLYCTALYKFKILTGKNEFQ